jgi:hypothetical protein
MKSESRRKMYLSYYWERHRACLERGDEVKAAYWFKKFNEPAVPEQENYEDRKNLNNLTDGCIIKTQ